MTAGPARLPARVGVLGGGRMGVGIAHAFLVGGSRVVVVDADDRAAGVARQRVGDAVRRSAEKGTLRGDVDPVLARLDATVGPERFAGTDLVVEAVPEDLGLKARLLADLATVVDESTVVATNTSSLSIGTLARHVSRPERFLGLHFFNPVPSSELVEIVVGAETDTGVVDAARGWVETLGKSPITVSDSPGFATSRLGVTLGLEAIRMLEDGVAPAAEIDAAMTLGYKHPIGPLRLTDLVGLDIRLGVANYLSGELGERFEAPQLLRDKVAAGELGRKAGQGFYTW